MSPEYMSTGGFMKNYYIRSNPGSADYLSILEETNEGYMVRIYRDLDGYEKIIEEFMTKVLFESCIRTGYLVEMEENRIAAIA